MGGLQLVEKIQSVIVVNILQIQSSVQNYFSECLMYKLEVVLQSFFSECFMYQKIILLLFSGCLMYEGGVKEEEIDFRNMVRYSCFCFFFYQIFSVIFFYRCIKVLSLNIICNCVIILSFIICIFIYLQYIRVFNVGRYDVIFFIILNNKIYLF